MAFSENFSANQTLGLPAIINLLDNSTGSDAAITSRRVFLQQYDASYLVPSGTTTNYIPWELSSNTIALNVLSVDTALNITTQWLSVTGVVLYEKTTLYVFTLYNEQFDYGLTSDQSADPLIVNNTEYYNNRIRFRVEIDNAQNAVLVGSDITSSQYSNNRATYIRLNQNLYF